MGGANESFETTCWTRLGELGSLDGAGRKAMTDHLIGRYWKPVYCYLRSKGFNNESAKDTTQGFFFEIVLEKGLFSQADEAKGRFRTFLLTALDRYVIDEFRYQSAQKRSPTALQSLEMPELPDLPEDHREARPDQVFHYAWASQLLDEVLTQVYTECLNRGQTIHWEVFNQRVLQPIRSHTSPVPIPELCRTLAIASESQASNMIVTVKRRFQRILFDRLQEVVGSEAELDSEYRDLIEILGTHSARS